MQTPELARKQAAGLYWLALLLTGRADMSADIAAEAVDHPETARKMVIARALAAIRPELRKQLVCQQTDDSGAQITLPVSDLSRAQVERALLGIDAFPRCTLVLRILEGLSLADTAALLEADADRIGEAQIAGVRALTRSIHSRHNDASYRPYSEALNVPSSALASA